MTPITQPWAKYSSDELTAATANTYGKGIDPSSVPELVEALNKLTEAVEHFKDMREKNVDPYVWDNVEYILATSLQNAKAAIDKSIIK